MIADAQLALDLRDAGIASLERHPWLERARRLAAWVGQEWGNVTSDDVQKLMKHDPPPHLNCWGALFKDNRFRSTGTHVQSKRPESHARFIQVWELNV